MMENLRVVVYPKDVQRITGRSERFGRQLIREIKEKLNKRPNQFVTVTEFSEHSGIGIEEVKKGLVD